MTIREQIEEREYEILGPYATFARDSKGRKRQEEECDIRTCFQRDRDRILHSRSFRRLKNKTQVFLEPEDDHYRTRLTHTLEVAQIARTISKALALNEDLTEAIALGHDLGHTPFGHSGEKVLNEILVKGGAGHFDHAEQSVRIVERLERDGTGLNLTLETLDGILNHGTECRPATLEGAVVRISDKIAYLHHDADDAIRAGVLTEEEMPRTFTDVLGHSVKERLNFLVHDIIENSSGKPEILQSPAAEEAMQGLRAFMFDAVYTNDTVKHEEEKAKAMIRMLYEYYIEHFGEIPDTYRKMKELGDAREIIVCDYISGMTDQYAVQRYEQLFVPKGWGMM